MIRNKIKPPGTWFNRSLGLLIEKQKNPNATIDDIKMPPEEYYERKRLLEEAYASML
jgi:hypothetical protein